MPCYDNQSHQDNTDNKKRLDEATRVACELGKLIEGTELEDKLSPQSEGWLKAHYFLDNLYRKRQR